MKQALFWDPLPGDQIQCHLCPHECNIALDQTGICRARVNRKGILYADNYAKVSSWGLDPIEKKPLYHFHPGKSVLSLGTVGCNFRCTFCQNYSISQEPATTRDISPKRAVHLAKELGQDCIGLAYTYSEPLMWYEYVLDTATLAKASGLKNVVVTNGYINSEPLKALLPMIQALNIDLKSFNDGFYRKLCGGQLDPVLRTIEEAVRARCHVELTTLIIPTKNDSPEEIKALSRYIADISPDIPLHLSRYFPAYKLSLPPTPLATLEQASKICRERLTNVYIGNV